MSPIAEVKIGKQIARTVKHKSAHKSPKWNEVKIINLHLPIHNYYLFSGI